ncbi:MAG: hypothetical protein ACFFD4_20885 [Candidatus Odinarchaeota archaeon]
MRKFVNLLNNEMWNRRTVIIVLYVLLTGYISRVISEVIHELGHGLLAVLFGVRIDYIHISLITPFDISLIDFNDSSLTLEQHLLVSAGGMIAGLTISFGLQLLLLVKRINWKIALPATWLAYWCYSNETGNILGGVLTPPRIVDIPGDMTKVMMNGTITITPFMALVIFIILYFAGFFAISTILRRMAKPAVGEEAKYLIVLFWVNVPLNIALYILTTGYIFAIIIGVIPVIVSYLLEFQVVRRVEKNLPENSHVHKSL